MGKGDEGRKTQKKKDKSRKTTEFYGKNTPRGLRIKESDRINSDTKNTSKKKIS